MKTITTAKLLEAAIKGAEKAGYTVIKETTCAGGIASVAMPLGSTNPIKRKYP